MKRIKTLLLSLLIAICCFSPVAMATSESDAHSRALILAAINHYRFKQGLMPLEMNAVLSAEAEKHSRDMALKRLPFGHAGFSGRSQRLFAHFKQAGGAAENVAFNYADATKVVGQWLASRGHRENIKGDYNLTGLGLAWDKTGRVYVTQLFLRAVR